MRRGILALSMESGDRAPHPAASRRRGRVLACAAAALMVSGAAALRAGDGVPGGIAGRVRLAGSDAPVGGARVVVQTPQGNPVAAAFSGPDGAYRIAPIPAGDYGIAVSGSGMRAAPIVSVTVAPARELRVDLALQPLLLERLTVGGAAGPSGQGLSLARLTRERIDSGPAALSDPLRALDGLPGVAAAGDLKSEMRIRGGDPSETLVLVDGLPLPYAFHFAGGGGSASTLGSESVDEVRVESGGFSAEYGDAMAGVVDVTTRAPRPDRIGGSAGVSTVRARAALSGPAGAGDWSLSARASDLGLYEDRVDVDGVDHVSFSDLQAGMRFVLPGAARLGVSLVRNDDAYRQALGAGESAAMDGTYRGGRILLEAPFGGDGLVRLSVDDGVLSSDSSASGGLGSVQDQRRQDLRLAIARHFGAHEIRTGLEGQRSTGSMVGTVWDGSASVASAADGGWWSGGTWLEDLWRSGSVATLRVGARVDRSTVRGETVLQPRASLELAPGGGLRFRFASGRFAQFPRQDQLFLAAGAPLRSQTTDQHIVGVEKTFRAFRIVVEGYLKLLHRPIGESINRYPELPEMMAQFDSGRTRGLEFTAESAPGSAWRWRFSGERLSSSEIADGVTSPRAGDQRQVASLLAGRRLGGGWEVTGLARYGSGLPYTPEVIATDGISYWVGLGALNGARLPAWWRLDLHLSRAMKRDWGSLRFDLDLQNVTDRENVRSIDLDFNAGEAVFYRTVRYQTPFLPVVGIAAEF